MIAFSGEKFTSVMKIQTIKSKTFYVWTKVFCPGWMLKPERQGLFTRASLSQLCAQIVPVTAPLSLEFACFGKKSAGFHVEENKSNLFPSSQGQGADKQHLSSLASIAVANVMQLHTVGLFGYPLWGWANAGAPLDLKAHDIDGKYLLHRNAFHLPFSDTHLEHSR